MPFALHPLYVLSGFAVGFLVGMTGVGGGALMTPLLILLFHVHPTTAVGTDLLYASITKSCGTVVHGFSRNVDWRIVSRLTLGSIPAALLTLAVLYLLKVNQETLNGVITKVLGFSLLQTIVRRILLPLARLVGSFSHQLTSLLFQVAAGLLDLCLLIISPP